MSAGMPAASARSSSPPETTSAPSPARASVASTARLGLALTAKAIQRIGRRPASASRNTRDMALDRRGRIDIDRRARPPRRCASAARPRRGARRRLSSKWSILFAAADRSGSSGAARDLVSSSSLRPGRSDGRRLEQIRRRSAAPARSPAWAAATRPRAAAAPASCRRRRARDRRRAGSATAHHALHSLRASAMRART